jgi:hypothetical protein
MKPIKAFDNLLNQSTTLTGSDKHNVGFALIFDELDEDDPALWKMVTDENKEMVLEKTIGRMDNLKYFPFDFRNYVDFKPATPPRNLASFGWNCIVPLLRKSSSVPGNYKTMKQRKVGFVFKLAEPYAVYLKR